MQAHLKLYKSTLHNPSFTLPFVFLEAIYALVSHLNGCTYAWTHHSTNMANLRGADGEDAKQALADGRYADFWAGPELTLLGATRVPLPSTSLPPVPFPRFQLNFPVNVFAAYARALTIAPADREGLSATFQVHVLHLILKHHRYHFV